jgi:hypothetical protein
VPSCIPAGSTAAAQVGGLLLTFRRPEALCSVTRRNTMQGSSYTVPAAQCSTRGGAPGGITVTSGLSATAADAAAALPLGALVARRSAAGDMWSLLAVMRGALQLMAGTRWRRCQVRCSARQSNSWLSALQQRQDGGVCGCAATRGATRDVGCDRIKLGDRAGGVVEARCLASGGWGV